MWNEEIERDFINLKKAFIDSGIQAISIHIDHSLEQGEHRGGVISSAGRTGKVPQMLGEEV